MRKIAAFAALVALTLSLTVTPVLAVISQGNAAITRLWAGDDPACSASYPMIQTGYDENLVYVLSAGHCTVANYAKRDVTDSVLYKVDWRAMLLGRYGINRRVDVAIGTVPRPSELPLHKRLWLADTMPREGAVWIAGFPLAVESVVIAQVIGEDPELPGSVLIQVRDPYSILPGSSGSAVLNKYGQIVGVVWGVRMAMNPITFQGEPTGTVIVTPVEEVHKLLKLLKEG